MKLSASTLKILARQSFQKWNEDRATTMAAGLAFYTMFSIAPLLLIVIAIAGAVFGAEAAQGRILGELAGILGPESAEAIQAMLANAHQSGGGVLAGITGFLALLAGATGVLVELQSDLNVIWKTAPQPSQGIMGFIKTRLLSVGLVLGFGFLMLVSLVLHAGLAAFDQYLQGILPGLHILLQLANYLVSFALVTGLFALIYRFLPNTEVEWDDVWVGAVVTAILFTVGRFFIGLYMSQASVASSYGAAGSLVVLLLWLYYSGLIFFLGAEFTYQYAHSEGSRAQTAPRGGTAPSAPAPAAGPVPALGAADAHSHTGHGGGYLPAARRQDFLYRHAVPVISAVVGSGLLGGLLAGRRLNGRRRGPKAPHWWPR